MRLPLLLLALAVTAPALAGCLNPDVPDPGDTVKAFVDPIVDDHDHADFDAHALATQTLEKIGYDPLGVDGKPFSYIGEIDTHEDLVVLQILGRGSTPGFVLIDVSDPADPELVGRAEMPDQYVVDVKFSPDGKLVFAASQSGPAPGDAARGEQAAATDGVLAWDVSDPANPAFVSATVVPPLGCHMLAVKDYAGARWVFCVGASIEIFSWEQDRLVPRAQYAPQSGTGVLPWVQGGETLPGPLPHDMTWVEDPVDGTPLLFVSYWDLGLYVVDVSNPLAPLELGSWAGEGATRYEGNVHSAMPTVVNGQRVLVAAPELLGNTVPAVYVLDAADYANLQLAAEWIGPGEHGAQSLLLTTHQFQLVGERMYLAYNHGGVWVLDLAGILEGGYEEDPARPEILGYYLPHEQVEFYDPERAAVPNTWDLNVKNGYIYASDRYTGFYVLHYLPDELGSPEITGFA